MKWAVVHPPPISLFQSKESEENKIVNHYSLIMAKHREAHFPKTSKTVFFST
jgi:hypothetical protein